MKVVELSLNFLTAKNDLNWMYTTQDTPEIQRQGQSIPKMAGLYNNSQSDPNEPKCWKLFEMNILIQLDFRRVLKRLRMR